MLVPATCYRSLATLRPGTTSP